MIGKSEDYTLFDCAQRRVFDFGASVFVDDVKNFFQRLARGIGVLPTR